MNPDTPDPKVNTSPFHLLPNQLVDEILLYVFQEATQADLSSTNSTSEEFTPYFDSVALENIDHDMIKLTLYKDMFGELAETFLEISMQLEGNVGYVLGKCLVEFEREVEKRKEIVEEILRAARKRVL